MSTRSNVQFVKDGEKYQLYVHWDGHPSYKIPFLQRFIKWNGDRLDDISYTVCNFVTFGKLETLVDVIRKARSKDKDKFYKQKDIVKHFENPDKYYSILKLGYGITPISEPTDKDFNSLFIEWFYRINLDNKTIEIIKPRYKSQNGDYVADKPKVQGVIKFDQVLSNEILEKLDEGLTLEEIKNWPGK